MVLQGTLDRRSQQLVLKVVKNKFGQGHLSLFFGTFSNLKNP